MDCLDAILAEALGLGILLQLADGCGGGMVVQFGEFSAAVGGSVLGHYVNGAAGRGAGYQVDYLAAAGEIVGHYQVADQYAGGGDAAVV